jgi:hypothetical protein
MYATINDSVPGVAELRYEIQKAHNSNSYSLLRVRLCVKEIHT